MANFRISDFPNTATLTDQDLLEVSTFLNGSYTSKNVNVSDLSTEIANRIEGGSSDSKRVIPTRYGIGTWSYIWSAGSANHQLTFPSQTSSFSYQEIDVRLDEFGTVPDNATHVELRGILRIARLTSITNGVSFAGTVAALEPGESVSTYVNDLNQKFTTSNASEKQALKGKLDGKIVVHYGWGTNSEQDEEGFNMDSVYVKINRSGSFPTAKVVFSINSYQNPDPARNPSLSNLHQAALTFMVGSFLV